MQRVDFITRLTYITFGKSSQHQPFQRNVMLWAASGLPVQALARRSAGVCASIYICMYIYVYTYIHTYIYIHIHTHIDTHKTSKRRGTTGFYRMLCSSFRSITLSSRFIVKPPTAQCRSPMALEWCIILHTILPVHIYIYVCAYIHDMYV